MIDHDTMRVKNLGQIFNHIRMSDDLKTKRELQDETGLSWATVSGSITDLLQKGFIIEVDNRISSKAGRPAKAYDVNPDNNLLIGVDINVEGLHFVLIDMKCRVLYSLSRMLIEDDMDSVLEVTKECIWNVITQSGVKRETILGIGFALMGAVDTNAGIAVYFHLIKNWHNVNIKQIFEQEFGLPVLVEHDPDCLAIAEMNIGVGQRFKNIVFLRVSLGIGMSQFINGELNKGSGGVAGEIGHMCMDRTGPACYCGKRGCVEAYASISGIARRYNENTKPNDYDFHEHSIEKDIAIVHRLAKAAQSGDADAQAYFDRAGEILGISIGNLISLMDPNLVIIGGAFSEYAPLYMDRIKIVADEVRWPYSKANIVLSTLKPHAAAIGAAALFIQRNVWETMV